MVGVAHGNGIVVAIEADQGEAIGRGRYFAARIEGSRGQGQESRLIFPEQFLFGAAFPAHAPLQVLQATPAQVAVQFLHAVHPGDRHEEVGE